MSLIEKYFKKDRELTKILIKLNKETKHHLFNLCDYTHNYFKFYNGFIYFKFSKDYFPIDDKDLYYSLYLGSLFSKNIAEIDNYYIIIEHNVGYVFKKENEIK